MAYLLGLVTPEEAEVLRRRGWRLETSEEMVKEILDTAIECRERQGEVLGPSMRRLRESLVGVFVDNDLYNIMSGPDWDKSEELRESLLRVKRRYTKKGVPPPRESRFLGEKRTRNKRVTGTQAAALRKEAWRQRQYEKGRLEQVENCRKTNCTISSVPIGPYDKGGPNDRGDVK